MSKKQSERSTFLKANADAARRRPTTEEYRLAKLRAGREATRAVRRTLIVVALLAGIYYCYLTATQKNESTAPPVQTPVQTPTLENGSPVDVSSVPVPAP